MKKTDKTVDGSLVLQYQSGNKKALALLVKRWHKEFCKKAYWVTKDADVSKDIAQDCWKVIMSKLHALENGKSFGSWALTIVYRKSIDWIRTNKKEIEKRNKYNSEQSDSAEEEENNGHLKRELLKAIALLSEDQQMIIKLFYVQEYTLQEISALLNIAIGTAKSRLFHAREKLKQTLKNKNYEN